MKSEQPFCHITIIFLTILDLAHCAFDHGCVVIPDGPLSVRHLWMERSFMSNGPGYPQEHPCT